MNGAAACPATALLADDEPHLARALAAELARLWPALRVVHTARNGVEAAERIAALAPDVAFLDIQMPGLTGLEVAEGIEGRTRVVFVTAYDEYAVQAFELEAADYLTKPVRLERLQRVLQKVQRMSSSVDGAPEVQGFGEALIIQERGRSERVALLDIVYLKAELKYITVRTAEKEHIYDGALSDLEQRYGHLFVRVHRNALVAVAAIRELQARALPQEGDEGSDGWAVRVAPLDEWLMVSRRQLAAVRAVLAGSSA